MAIGWRVIGMSESSRKSRFAGLRRQFTAASLGCVMLAGGGYAAHRNANYLLGIAATTGVTAAVEPIIWLGADDTGKNRALATAADRGGSAMVAILLRNGADIHANDDLALVMAAFSGRTDTARMLLDQGGEVNAANGAPLIWAATNGHKATVLLLCNRGADVHAMDNQAIKQATRHGHEDIAEVLRERVADERKPVSVRLTPPSPRG
jgi:hypothetical protein